MSATGNISQPRSVRDARMAELFALLDADECACPRSVAEAFSACTSLVAAFQVTTHCTENNGESPVRSLMCDEADLPDYILQRALALALRPCSTGINVERALSPDGAEYCLISLTSHDGGTLLGLFEGPSASAVLESAILGVLNERIRNLELVQESEKSSQLAANAAIACELVATVESESGFDAACPVLAERLALLLARSGNEADGHASPTVWICEVDRNDRCRLTAQSGRQGRPPEDDITLAVRAAAQECLARRLLTRFPAGNGPRHSLLCHQQLAKLANCEAVVSICLVDQTMTPQAVATFAGAGEYDRLDSLLRSVAQPLGTSLKLLKKLKKSRVESVVDSIARFFCSDQKKTFIRLAIATVCLSMIPAPHYARTDCEVVPAVQQVVGAPMAGRLLECLVEPGDEVLAGQLLARMDDREVRLELREIQAELHHAMRKRDGHVQRMEAGETRLATLEVQRLEAKVDLLLHQLDRLEIRSPVAGVVTLGDLKKQEGAQLEYGQQLFEVAPLDALQIEVAIPDEDVRLVGKGMPATVRLDAWPFRQWKGSIDSVHAASEIRGNQNVFIGKLAIDGDQGELKPGMRGTARVQTGWATLGWNLLHKPAVRAGRWMGW